MLPNRVSELQAFPIAVNATTPKTGIIYFLIYKEVIVYIGKTANLTSRISTHIRSGKAFDSVKYYEIDYSALSSIETEEINTYSPLYNERIDLKEARDKRPDYLRFGDEIITRSYGTLDSNDEFCVGNFFIFKELHKMGEFISVLYLQRDGKISILSEEFPAKRSPLAYKSYILTKYGKSNQHGEILDFDF